MRLIFSLILVGALALGLVTVANADPKQEPPGQGPCSHGYTGKPCKEDPQPDKGKDCLEHGNKGGVNEDHCLTPVTTTTPVVTSTSTTPVITTTSVTTVTVTTTPTVTETTTPPEVVIVPPAIVVVPPAIVVQQAPAVIVQPPAPVIRAPAPVAPAPVTRTIPQPPKSGDGGLIGILD